MNKEKSLIVFQDKKIRRIWHDEEWFFLWLILLQSLLTVPPLGSIGVRLRIGSLLRLNCPQFGYS